MDPQQTMQILSHFGLPRGTSSRAREIPLGPHQHGPKPLRASVTQVVRPWWVTFHSCMFGGMRPKRTTIASDLQCLQELAAECTNQHVHLPWGITPHGFATADEVEYPIDLCRRRARLVFDFIKPGYTAPKALLPAHPDKKATAVANRQTKKSFPFIPEWSHIEVRLLPSEPPLKLQIKLEDEFPAGDVVIPGHRRILRISPKTIANTGEEEQSSRMWEIAYGAPWTVESFIQEALERGHPASMFDGLASDVKRAIAEDVEKDRS